MTRQAICPQRHVWSPVGTDAFDHELICPVCGLAGAATPFVAPGTNLIPDTQTVAHVPRGDSDATLSIDPAMRSARGLVEVELPTLPGYDLLRELGRGGMGVVYLARHQQLNRLVAVKMILTGYQSSRDTRERFFREATAVARLQHPGIVQIHDVGEHEGRPYFALEYVEGSNLYSQLLGQPVAARIAAGLVDTLAQTMHYAHQRGIVHRDLTPRNILLARCHSSPGFRLGDAEAEVFDPKITDFGLAKELDADNSQTQTGVIMGTPNYMAPEQAQGLSSQIGPATDVFSLGAILYELLTGRPPFLAATKLDTLTQVIHSDPVLPTRLQPRIPHDVETICLKCLEKDPRKRYASAQELADDLHRFLASKPILARPVPWTERAQKWVRRHPAATALLAVIAFSLITLSIGGTLYSVRVRGERDRAENNLDLALQAVDEMLSRVGEQQLAAEPHTEDLRRKLLQRALVLTQKLLTQNRDNPRAKVDVAAAHRRMADIYRYLEQHREALDAYAQAVTLFRQLLDSPHDAEYRQQLALCLNNQGESLRSAGRAREAEESYDEAVRLDRQLVAEESADDEANRQELARALYNLGIFFREGQRPQQAERVLREAADLLSRLVEQDPESAEHRHHLARAWTNLGTVLRAARPAEALASYDTAMALLLALGNENPHQPDYRFELAVTGNNLGNLLSSQQRYDEAQARHRNSRELLQTLAADFPRVPTYRQELANTLNSIGSVCSAQDQVAETVSAWNQAAALLEKLVVEREDVVKYQGDLGMVLGNLGLMHVSAGRLTDARSHFERAIDRLRQALAVIDKHPVYREILRDNYQNLAEVLIQSREHAAGVEAARALAEVLPESAWDSYFAGCFLARCVGLVPDDAKLDSVQREALQQSYAEESMALLRRAVRLGFIDVPRLQSDRESVLQGVAEREDFQSLAQELAARPAPQAP